MARQPKHEVCGGFRKGEWGGGEKEKGKGGREWVGSREGYTDEQRGCGCLVILKGLWPALRIASSGYVSVEWCGWWEAKVYSTPCVSMPTFCVVCIAMTIQLSIIVPCYKRVFVAECHNRYSEVLWQGSLNTRYAVGFGRESGGGERKRRGRGEGNG